MFAYKSRLLHIAKVNTNEIIKFKKTLENCATLRCLEHVGTTVFMRAD